MKTRTSLPDHYVPQATIGQGPWSTVLRAHDRRTERTVVIKSMPSPAWMTEEEAETRSRNMATALHPLTMLRHRSLAAVYEIGEHGGTFYQVREPADGSSLRELLHRHGPLSLSEAHRIAVPAAEALDALADAGLSHGALTAENLFIGTDGRVQWTDAGFGRAAASLTLAGVCCRRIGSPSRFDDRTALAALLFEALVGCPPQRWDGFVSRAYHLPLSTRESLYRALHDGAAASKSASALIHTLFSTARPDLFQLAWRPAAAIGLFASLVTIDRYAFPERPKMSPIVSSSATLSPAGPAGAPMAEAQAPTASVVAPPPAELRSLTVETLSEEDREAIRIAMRRQGPAALAHPAIAGLFDLSSRQRDEIANCLTQERQRVEKMVEAAANGLKTDSLSAMRTAREITRLRILRLLTSRQRLQWQEVADAPQATDEPVL